MTLPRIGALLVDLGKVLVGFDHGTTVRRIAAQTGRPAEELAPALFGDLEADFDRGRLSPGEFFRAAEERAGLPPLPDALWVEAWRDIFWPLPHALDALARVRPGVRKVLVSNTNVVHWEGVLRVSDVRPLFDALCLSFEVGAVKPEPAMWAAALAAGGVPPGETLFADDRPALVAAARANGIEGFVVDGPEAFARGLGSRGLLLDPPRE